MSKASTTTEIWVIEKKDDGEWRPIEAYISKSVAFENIEKHDDEPQVWRLMCYTPYGRF